MTHMNHRPTKTSPGHHSLKSIRRQLRFQLSVLCPALPCLALPCPALPGQDNNEVTHLARGNQGGSTNYEYYEKPNKSKVVLSKDSAMPMSKKIDTLSQEVFRRLHNSKHEIEWAEKIPVLEKYMCELKQAGYTKKDRAEILKSGVTRYQNLKEKEKKGIRPFFRKRSFEEQERSEEKEKKKSNWFNLNKTTGLRS